MSQKIPLTLGFGNVSGDDLAPLVSEDAALLSQLFERVRIVPAHLIPAAEVLCLYATLTKDGRIPGTTAPSIRDVAQRAQARIAVLASPNPVSTAQMAMQGPGPRTANIVITLSRNGKAFGKFFFELFELM